MKPAKIICLVPSLTELIIDLGLKESLAGRTRFCIHPDPVVQNIPIVGGTKNPRIDKITDISPDLIIANKEENRKKDIEELEKHFAVYLTDISTIEDALITIHKIGGLLEEKEKTAVIIHEITKALTGIPDEDLIRVAYLIWREPWMTVGSDTYIHSVLTHWKLDNIFKKKHRYPKIRLSDIAAENPDYILLSSEPYPFKEKHKAEIGEVCTGSDVLLVNGEWFSWYGSRMLPSFKKLNTFRKAISR